MLKFISIGQHTTKFYRKRRNRYGSTLGGTVTLLVVASFLFYAVWNLYRCIALKDVTRTIEPIRINLSDLKNVTYKQFADFGFPVFETYIYPSFDTYETYGSDLFSMSDWYSVETRIGEKSKFKVPIMNETIQAHVKTLMPQVAQQLNIKFEDNEDYLYSGFFKNTTSDSYMSRGFIFQVDRTDITTSQAVALLNYTSSSGNLSILGTSLASGYI